ncbi:MAG TPA: signal peptidase I [Rectinemataceae bacterium]|nr:signal peptidase I [Rectinemataceae bacterium]
MLWAGKRRSYAEAVENRRKTFARLLMLLMFFMAFEVLSGLFLTAYSAGSTGMSPTVLPSDHLLATPLAFGPRTPFGKLPGFAKPERGDLVLVQPPYAEAPGFFVDLANSFVRFVTFQRFSPFAGGASRPMAGPIIARVVGLPGDSISMEDFVFKAKAAGEEHFLTEFELSSHRYDISKSALPELWQDGFPASGTMAARSLGPDEYFLAGDARSGTSDSRLWGPVHADRFLAKVLLRYWPPSRFGIP